jgi:hypothetical protein
MLKNLSPPESRNAMNDQSWMAVRDAFFRLCKKVGSKYNLGFRFLKQI